MKIEDFGLAYIFSPEPPVKFVFLQLPMKKTDKFHQDYDDQTDNDWLLGKGTC